MNFRLLIFYTFIISLSPFSFSQKYPLKLYGVKDGLASNKVNQIIQDSSGFIWIATFNGLVRFDGREFKIFDKTQGLSSNKIRNIYIDSQNNLWCTSWKEGINCLKNDSIIQYNIDSAITKSVGSGIVEDEYGNIWVVGRQELLRLEKNGTDFEVYDSTHHIHAMSNVFYRNDSLWITTFGNGVYVYDIKNKKTVRNYRTKQGLTNNIGYVLFQSKSSRLYVGCYGGFSEIKSDTIISHTFNIDYNKNRVSDIFEMKNGNLLLALYGNGYIEWDTKKDEIIKWVDNNNGIDHGIFLTIIQDQDDNIWAGTYENGVYFLKDYSIKTYNKDNKLPTNEIYRVISIDGVKYGLTSGHGFFTFQNDTFTHYPLDDTENGLTVLSICKRNDTLWISTNSGVGYYVDNIFTRINNYQGASDQCEDCILTEDNEIYFAGENSLFKIENRTLIPFFIKKGYTQNAVTKRLAYHPTHGVWGATYSSICFLNQQTNQVNIFKPGVNSTKFYSSIKFYNEKLYVTGENKLYQIEFNQSDTLLKEFDVVNDPSVSFFYSMDIVNDVIWFSYEGGVVVGNLNDIINGNSNPLILTYEDGMPYTEAYDIYLDDENNAWISTFEGLVHVDLTKQNLPKHPPKVYFKLLELFSENIDKNCHDFNYNQNHFTIHWGSIGFYKANKIQFTYQLKGFDTQWSKPSTDRKTVYSNLNPGSYTFLIKTRYPGMNWSEKTVLYSFTIHPPFWKRWWFIILSTLLILSLFSVVIFIRFNQLNKKRERAEFFSKQLMVEQEKERKKISRDLHDSVGQMLMIARNKMIQHPENGALPLVELDEAIAEVRLISRQLQPYQLDKFGLTRAIEILVEKAGSSSDIYFTEDIEDLSGILNKDQELIVYRLIQEAINNIIKHSKATSANVTITTTSNAIQIIIQDNGVGVNVKQIINNRQHSFGLEGMFERIELLKGEINFRNVKEGTKIYIFIPL